MKSHFGERRVDGTPSERRPPAGSLPGVEPTNYSDSGSMGGGSRPGGIYYYAQRWFHLCLFVRAVVPREVHVRAPIAFKVGRP